MLDPLRRIPRPLLLALALLAFTGIMAATLWFDPQRGQQHYAYTRDTTNVNSNDLSSGIVGYYTRALFIVTAVLSIVAVVQIYFLIKADKNARDALVADQRAFVFATSLIGEWRKQADGSFTWIMRPVWRNAGKTPTRRLRVMTSGELRDRPVGQDVDPSRDDGLVGSGLLGPQTENRGGTWPAANQLTQKDLADIIAGRRTCYLWGYARYFDVFDDKTEHITRFCWTILPGGDALKVPRGAQAPAIIWNYVQNLRGNCADDECDR